MTRSLHIFSAIDVVAWTTTKTPVRAPMTDGPRAAADRYALAARCACP